MIFTEGFGKWLLDDITPILAKWDGGNGSLSTQDSARYDKIPGRFSSTCIAKIQSYSISYSPKKVVTTDSHYILGMAFKIYGSAPTNAAQMFGTLNGTSRVLSLVMGTDSKIAVMVGTTTLTTLSNIFKANRWSYIEVEHYLHATSGVINIWVNETLVYTFTGDTRGSTSFTNITAFDLWDTLNSGSSIAIDDLYYLTSTGLTLPWGDTHVKEFNPTSDVSNSGFTLSTGTDLYATINKPFTTATTPNVSASVVDSQFLVDTTDVIGSATANVKLVAFNIRAIKSDAGARNLAGVFHIGSTDYVGTDTPLSAVDDLIYDPFLLSPATGIAWTKAEVEAMSFGAKVTV